MELFGATSEAYFLIETIFRHMKFVSSRQIFHACVKDNIPRAKFSGTIQQSIELRLTVCSIWGSNLNPFSPCDDQGILERKTGVQFLR